MSRTAATDARRHTCDRCGKYRVFCSEIEAADADWNRMEWNGGPSIDLCDYCSDLVRDLLDDAAKAARAERR